MTSDDPAQPVEMSTVGATADASRGSMGRSRTPIIVAGWVIAVLSIVGVAVIGQGSDASPAHADPLSVAVADAPSAATPHAPRPLLAPALVPLTEDRLTVTRPPTRNVAIRTRAVDIAGVVSGGGRVVVTLESRGSHLLESMTVDAGPDGRFRVSFALPNPRPGGRMWVSAVLVADNGLPIEAIRRPIVSGPLQAATLGDDGLIGGIGHPTGG
jgi:hypothetical protein